MDLFDGWGESIGEIVQRNKEHEIRALQRLWKKRKKKGLCPECGADIRDGNCSPLYDEEGLCADCGERRFEEFVVDLADPERSS